MKKSETETTIAFTKADKQAIVYTEMKDWMRKLDGYCGEFPEEYKEVKADEHSKTYYVPAERVKITKPRKINRKEKEQLTQRLKKARNSVKK